MLQMEKLFAQHTQSLEDSPQINQKLLPRNPSVSDHKESRKISDKTLVAHQQSAVRKSLWIAQEWGHSYSHSSLSWPSRAGSLEFLPGRKGSKLQEQFGEFLPASPSKTWQCQDKRNCVCCLGSIPIPSQNSEPRVALNPAQGAQPTWRKL